MLNLPLATSGSRGRSLSPVGVAPATANKKLKRVSLTFFFDFLLVHDRDVYLVLHAVQALLLPVIYFLILLLKHHYLEF